MVKRIASYILRGDNRISEFCCLPVINYYDEVDKVKNISCLDLCDILNKFTSEQVEMLFKEIDNRATNLNNSEYTHFKKISETAKKKENKLEAIVEYIKAGTATASFITALFTLAKSLTG